MSDERESDTSDISRARTQQTKKQQAFLAFYRRCANVKSSCEAAKISRQTFYRWKEHDAIFAIQLAEAEKEADDAAEKALYDRAIEGVEEYVISNRQVVFLEVETDGKKERVPLKHRVYSDRLLEVLLKARMPDKYKEKQQIEHKIESKDLSKLSAEELALAEQLAKKASEADGNEN